LKTQTLVFNHNEGSETYSCIVERRSRAVSGMDSFLTWKFSGRIKNHRGNIWSKQILL